MSFTHPAPRSLTGFLNRLLTWEGIFVPRFMRRTNAEDLRGTVPALLGQTGCVRELVDLANQHGFFWGGHFSSPRDGMHFEAGMSV